MAILITGGTGFVGSHTVAALAGAAHEVRLLVRDPRKPARVPALRGIGFDTVVGDVTDREAVIAAMEGCTGVVHSAAHVSLAEREAERAIAVNVGGTRTVLETAVARGIPAVVVSSIAVFDRGGGRITPESPLVAHGGSYTRSKVGAERVARNAQDAGAPVSIVYPSGVLGPDSPGVSVNHQALVGWVRTPPATTSGTSIVDVRDVARAVVASLDAPGRWMLGGTYLSWSELHDAITDVTGIRRRTVPMPPRLLRGVGRIGDLVKRVVDFDYPLTYEAMSMATQAVPPDSTATQRELGVQWRPVRETLADSIGWLAATHHLPPKLAGRLAA